MAKFGEGDKRWIVSDRPDGTNVHNWHWSERDCLSWSKSQLTNLLSDLDLIPNSRSNNGLSIKTVTLDSITGEAYVNIRKGKIIPGYELSLSISFVGRSMISSTEFVDVNGTIEIPYLADENAGEDPEIRVVVKDDSGQVGNLVKDAILVEGKKMVFEKIRVFVDAMAKGGPAKDELETKKVVKSANSETNVDSVSSTTAGSCDSGVKKEEEKKKEEKKKGKEGFKTIRMTERFYCRAVDMYDILMDENRWKGFTQSNARISKDIGGAICLFDGSVTGTNEELQEGKLIVQKWRFGSWPDGIHSTVRLVFEEPEPGVTVIKLTHTDVPEEDRYGNATVVENTERGWRDLIFHKIRAVFGFGI